MQLKTDTYKQFGMCSKTPNKGHSSKKPLSNKDTSARFQANNGSKVHVLVFE